jgi:hypothetical protein
MCARDPIATQSLQFSGEMTPQRLPISGTAPALTPSGIAERVRGGASIVFVLWLAFAGTACSDGTQEVGRMLPESSSGSGGASIDFGNADANANKPSEHTLASGAAEDAGSADGGFGTGCASAQYSAKLAPLDMFILLDQSGSMTEDDDRWTPTTKALKAFVSSSRVAGMGVSLQYFPLGASDDLKCESSTYAAPDVEMNALPDNAQPIIDSIDAHYFTKDECCDTPEHDGTPTRPAMEGAVTYMRAWVKAHRDHAGVILLATDGEPSPVCDDNGIDEVSDVIADAAKGSPAIPTYVIGIGHEDKLQELAEAGDTGLDALIVDGTGVDTESDLSDALAKVRGQALSCDFPLPDGADIDPLDVNIQRTTATGETITLVNVKQKADCDDVDRPAWYYDDREHPTRVFLCPVTCDDVVSDVQSRIEIVVGCATVVLI